MTKDQLPDVPPLMAGFLHVQQSGRATRPLVKPKAVILDIDGTIADGSHRMHLAPGKGSAGTPEEWAPWEAAVEDDPVIEHVAMMVGRLAHTPWGCHPIHIVVMTGRGSNCHDRTQRWLKKNNIPFSAFFGRDKLDTRPSAMLKEAILLEQILPSFNVLFALEDQSSCVEMFRRNGVPCFHVADGGF